MTLVSAFDFDLPDHLIAQEPRARIDVRARDCIELRARARDAWISINATSPCTSGSSGIRPARTRPRRSASSQSAGRIQSSPRVAE